MKLFSDALLDTRRTLDNVQVGNIEKVVLRCLCDLSRNASSLQDKLSSVLAAKAAEARERSQRLNELFASQVRMGVLCACYLPVFTHPRPTLPQVEVLVRCRTRLNRLEGEVSRDEGTFGEGTAAGGCFLTYYHVPLVTEACCHRR